MIAAQARIDLAVTGVDRHHQRRAVLQQAVREATGGSAHIHAVCAVHVDLPMGQRMFKFQAAPAYVSNVSAKQTDDSAYIDRRTRFLHLLLVHQDTSCQNQRLRPLTRRGQPALDQQFIDPDFVQKKFLKRNHSRSSTLSSAKWRN